MVDLRRVSYDLITAEAEARGRERFPAELFPEVKYGHPTTRDSLLRQVPVTSGRTRHF